MLQIDSAATAVQYCLLVRLGVAAAALASSMFPHTTRMSATIVSYASA